MCKLAGCALYTIERAMMYMCSSFCSIPIDLGSFYLATICLAPWEFTVGRP